jgi:glycosyltransferase involved in cell wall biosynthesis
MLKARQFDCGEGRLMNGVDVIVPCYRYGRFLRACVSSVLEQQGVAIRVLIIDDCSPDDTAEVARQLQAEDKRVSFVRHESNQGHIATYNEGIAWTRSEYYLLLSADDYLLPGGLSRTVSFMEEHPSVTLAFGQAIVQREQADVPQVPPAPVDAAWELVSGRGFIERSGARNCVPTPAAVVRTAVQKSVGGYRPDLPHAGDMEMWLRLAAHGDVGISQVFHAVYRRHSDNMSLNYMKSHWLPDLEQRQAALASFFRTADLGDQEREIFRRKAFRLLANEAVGFASAAFNSGDLATSQQLSDFASQLDSSIRASAAWLKLIGKRTVGVAKWLGVRNSVSRIRGAFEME